MLRINAIPNTAAAKAYYSQSDYYVEGQEQQAFWRGNGAEMLGLSGPVTKEDFESLCDNLHPGTGERLTARTVENRRVGYDFTFSVPKSVSLAYALGGDERVLGAVSRSVEAAMADVEAEMSARVRQGGKDEDRLTGNMVWAAFLHKTSRPIKGQPDPQLHVHAVVFNATHDAEEGQWKAGQFGSIKADAPFFEASWRARLADEMRSLGYEVTRTKDAFEVVGIPEKSVSEFSRRTRQIERLAEDLGVTRPESKAKLGATSREAKTKGLTWDDLQRLWSERVAAWDERAIHETVARARAGKQPPEYDHAAAISWAIAHLFERKSVVSERELVTVALKRGIGTSTPEGIEAELAKRKDLIRSEENGKRLVTTQEVLDEEKRIIKFAIQGRGRCRPIKPRSNALTLQSLREQPELSRSQQAAIRHVWNSPDRLMLIRGAAGVGKTTLTKAALSGVDRPWLILAPSAQASRGVLREEGFGDRADTLARFLDNEKFREKARDGLIWLDEASMAGARDVARLVQLADSLNARVVLSGDRRQHKSVSRGDVLALLEDKAGLPVAEVSEIKRQSGAYKEAVAELAKGNASRGFEMLDDLGWVKEVLEHDEERKERQVVNSAPHDNVSTLTLSVADDYLAALEQGKSVLAVSPTHAQAEGITRAIRDRLKRVKDKPILKGEEKKLLRLVPLQWTEAQRKDPSQYMGGEVVQFVRSWGKVKPGERFTVTPENVKDLAAAGAKTAVYRPDELPLMAGDLVRTTAGVKDTKGGKIDNGTMLTVAGFTEKGLKVRTASGTEKTLPQDAGHLAHGYVSTSHASQGRTVDVVLVAMGAESFGAVGKEQLYVSVSRGKQKATVYTDSREALQKAILREDVRTLAHDLIAKPKLKIRQRMKRHINFIRSFVSLGRIGREQQENEQTNQREYGGHER